MSEQRGEFDPGGSNISTLSTGNAGTGPGSCDESPEKTGFSAGEELLEGVFVQSGLKPPLFFDVHHAGGVHTHKQAVRESTAKEAAESSAVASSAVQS
ncbi:MAG: hypothetical protein EZS28_051639, partial [Streblomastix strix]